MKNLFYFIQNFTVSKSFSPGLIFLLVTMLSCSYEHKIDVVSEQVKLSFKADNNKITTYSLQANQISEIEALIFTQSGSDYVYSYRSTATSLTDAGNNTILFNLDVFVESNPVKIYFIANGKNALDNSGLQIGETESIIKSKMIAISLPDGMNINFPLWGEYVSPTGISAASLNVSSIIPLLPAVARIDVGTNLSPDTFNIISIQAYRVNEQNQIVPNNYTDSMTVSQPSVPVNTPIINTTPIAVTGNLSQDQLFLPESEAQQTADQNLKATCIIVGGIFNKNVNTTYYRLDFEPISPNTLTGQVLRDHLYTFDIKKVTSPGWETPDEAAQNIPTNIQVEILDWSDLNIDINSNSTGGSYYINITTRIIELADTIGSVGSVLIFTNILDYKIQWCDATGVPNGDPGNNLNDGVFNITATRNVVSITALQDNTSGSSIREEYFMIVGKRANIIVTVRQL